MPEQHPDLHLSFVELIAHTIEVVVKDVLQVVLLDVLELLVHLLVLFLTVIELHHDSQFSLEDL